jgi:hypothetical protein
MSDTYKYVYNNMASVASAVTPNDSTDLTTVAQGIYIGGAGDLKVDMADSGTVTFSGLPAGVFLPIIVKRVYSTGTTATNIIALV